MTMRTVLDKLQTTTIEAAFLPYVYHPDTISNYVQNLLEEHEPLTASDFSSLKKIHELEHLSDELKGRIFYLCIKSGIIESGDEDEGGSEEFFSASLEQQRYILSTIELLPLEDRTEETVEEIAILFQDVIDDYEALWEQLHLIPENQITQILHITTSPYGTEELGTEKALKLKFFLLLPECDQTGENWEAIENFVDTFLESIQEKYEEIEGYPPDERAKIICESQGLIEK